MKHKFTATCDLCNKVTHTPRLFKKWDCGWSKALIDHIGEDYDIDLLCNKCIPKVRKLFWIDMTDARKAAKKVY